MATKELPAFLKRKGAKDDDEEDGDAGHRAFVPKKKGKGKGKVPPQFLKHQGSKKGSDDGDDSDRKAKSDAVKKRLANLHKKD